MEELVSLVESAAQAAGAILRDYFQQKYTITHKSTDNPVTTADTEADAFLKEKLLSAYPDYGWLSEESADSAARLTKSRVWIVDPLDGTKEFIAGRPEFMVSIGLAENGQPVLGVLYNPITDELFSAIKGQGAFLNGSRIFCTQINTLSEAHLIVSRSELTENLWQPYRHFFKTLQPCGSVAYKLVKVASGKADLHISLKPKNEWDICAAHCLLTEAGAVLVTRDGAPILYNRKDPTIPAGVIAGNEKLVLEWQKITQLQVWN
ncbi:MAG TPA: 3'(2'),5'-bisphosphate nucleotidase CysQ [Candidatus Marinimicrobia bacterium]|nr:3'(2'),5'-bisphosphate nucleotidase CysQ [Candidatus Neomarinimicrobiota bacterium]HRS51941.1 3'(2'),5'-bisphosphate nucleotidase CysQ [Candidatus Neomarinimicrobiota bacterium]HRU91930.1 3'(2'),5'-bisphosphate nucleotidase CysQ [Candidatus Neomarinimicrobiota bacterium]